MVVQGFISFLSLELEEYFLSCNNSESLVTAFIINVMRNIYTHIYMYEQLMLGTIVSKKIFYRINFSRQTITMKKVRTMINSRTFFGDMFLRLLQKHSSNYVFKF